jgi:hypothetical protein
LSRNEAPRAAILKVRGQLLTALVAMMFFGARARHGRFGGAETRFHR